jgi:PKD repeat protein
MEGGSSGAFIFSEEGYIVGALSGGFASCNFQERLDYYGKFSYSWASNGTDSTRQLQPWLDPIDSGLLSLRGFDPDSSSFRALFTSNTTQVRVGGNVEFFNQSEGHITSYEWHFPGGEPETSEMASPPLINYNNAGEFDVMLVAISDTRRDTLLRKGYITVLPSLSPNPSTGRFRINFGKSIPDQLDISVTDMTGRTINFFLYGEDESTIILDLSTQRSGIYLVNIQTEGSKEVLKAMVTSHSD